MRITTVAVGFLLPGAMLTACAGLQSTTTEAPSWELSSQPIVIITDSAVPPGHEFDGVSSAYRFRDGGILVANAGARELVYFDSVGALRRSVGRKGQGPGEFQGPMSIFAGRADSLAVYDPALQRWTILGPDLAVARTAPVPSSEFLQPTWLYKGAIVVDGIVEPVPNWILTLLDSLRTRDARYTSLIHARRDEVGALWVRDSIKSNDWQVFTHVGPPVGSVVLPATLQPLQIGAHFIVGLVQDSLGIEEIRVHKLRRPDARTPPRDDQPALIPTEPAQLAPFRNLLVAQEVYYSTHARYASDADSLTLPTAFAGRLFLLGGDSRHWAAISVQPATGMTCGIAVGWPAPPGWLDGSPFCGR